MPLIIDIGVEAGQQKDKKKHGPKNVVFLLVEFSHFIRHFGLTSKLEITTIQMYYEKIKGLYLNQTL